MDEPMSCHDALRSAGSGLHEQPAPRCSSKPMDAPEEGEAVARGAPRRTRRLPRRNRTRAPRRTRGGHGTPWNSEGAAKDPEEGTPEASEEPREKKKPAAALAAEGA